MCVEWTIIWFTINITYKTIIIRNTINNLFDFTLWFLRSSSKSRFDNSTKTR